MPIIVDIDVMLARRKMSVGAARGQGQDHARQPGGVENGRAKAVRFTTLAALCEVLGASRGTSCVGTQDTNNGNGTTPVSGGGRV